MNFKINTFFDHELIHRALITATKAHHGQLRKDSKTPYITHPIMVAFIAQNYTKNSAVICAALLHDTIEDTNYTFNELQNDFGDEIFKIVQGVTEIEFAHRKNTTWDQRKTNYKMQLQAGPIESAIVSCADRIHNMTDIVRMHKEKGNKLWSILGPVSSKKRIQHYQEVSKILHEKLGVHPILAEQDKLLQQCKNLIS